MRRNKVLICNMRNLLKNTIRHFIFAFQHWTAQKRDKMKFGKQSTLLKWTQTHWKKMDDEMRQLTNKQDNLLCGAHWKTPSDISFSHFNIELPERGAKWTSAKTINITEMNPTKCTEIFNGPRERLILALVESEYWVHFSAFGFISVILIVCRSSFCLVFGQFNVEI